MSVTRNQKQKNFFQHLASKKPQKRIYSPVIFDVIHGFIPITEWEQKIINSPFYQRLRWIRQLGFSNYIFPGAEHNRFLHAIGVMHSMHRMLEGLGLAVSKEELLDPKATSPEAMFHKSMRLSALLHDIGTFPFSHAIEYAYLRHGIDKRPKRAAKEFLPNSHEHLGSFIIKNTRYKGGITSVLEDYGFDVQLISKIIKGDSPYLIANQLMHSDLDADRMDYLLRDAHYTGLKYGHFDRDYILANLQTFSASPSQMAFGVRESAIHAIEDFLISRFSWYSQVIKNPDAAKFDVIGTHIAQAFLKDNLIFQFQDLLEMIENQDERFFWWNDSYLIQRAQTLRYNNEIKNPHVAEQVEQMLYRRAPKTIHHPLFEHQILKSNEEGKRKKLLKDIHSLLDHWQEILKKYGTGQEWILFDIPEKDVVFTVIPPQKKRTVMVRDPVRIITKEGKPHFLFEVQNSLMKILAGYTNFVPSVYGNASAVKLLRQKKQIP